MCDPNNLKRGSLKLFTFFSLFLISLFLMAGCGSDVQVPIIKLKEGLKDVPTYSIILENMKEEGNFVKSYFHQYRVVTPEGAEITDWLKVPEPYYQKNLNFLGMTLLAKKDGVFDEAVTPPGYHYVGDPKYGQWRSDGRGGSFWAFYGQYRLMSDFLGGWRRPIYDTDFDAYKKFKKRNVPFYGLKNQYGTSGTIVKTAKPDFYNRYMSKQKAKSASFTDKVSKRIGRTRTSFRSRSGGRGK
jgi:hypothetical protein